MPVAHEDVPGEEPTPLSRIKEIKETVCRLASIISLRAEVLKNRHTGTIFDPVDILREILNTKLISPVRNRREPYICWNSGLSSMLVSPATRSQALFGQSCGSSVR